MKFKQKPNTIIVHCSQSPGGDAALVNDWHKIKYKQWGTGIGYHAVIDRLGGIQQGREWDEQGAHCAAQGMNKRAWGLCLMGLSGDFKNNQFDTLRNVCIFLCLMGGIAVTSIHGHSLYDPENRSFCPGFDVESFAARMFQSPHIVPPPPGGWY